MKEKIFLGLSVILFFSTLNLYGQSETCSLQQWKDDKFSMFIHFGLYSQLGGVYNGENITKGYSEQIQKNAHIYGDIYETYALKFNPNKLDVDSIALLAKNAGMRSIVITAKHHDGFCMWDTKTTDFNIVNATPFKRDVIKELSEACKRQGMKLGLYFSVIDWHYPQAYPMSSNNGEPVTPEHHAYSQAQLKELLTNYGPITEIWFDMGSQSYQYSMELKETVKRFQPNCLVSGRIGNGVGDFCVMRDNYYPDYLIGMPWQTPECIFHETWSWRSWQRRDNLEGKVKEKILALIEIIVHGGKYLLNIGPKDDGSIVPFEADLLRAMGKWVERNKDGIYETQPVSEYVKPFEWGGITRKGSNLNLFLKSFPKNGEIFLPNMNGKIIKAYVAGYDKVKIKYKSTTDGIHIQVPTELENQIGNFPMVVLNFENPPLIKPLNVLDFGSKLSMVELNHLNSEKVFSYTGVDYYSFFRSTIKKFWHFNAQKQEQVTPQLIYTDQEVGSTLKIKLNEQEFNVELDTVSPESLNNDLGKISFGDFYLSGKYVSRLGAFEEKIPVVDVNKKCTINNSNGSWTLREDFKLQKLELLEAGISNSYLVFSEINSDDNQQLLASVRLGDGIEVWLNGEEIHMINNPKREKEKDVVLLLDLKKGKNQLVVKLHNRFDHYCYFKFDPFVKQVVYKKNLAKINLKKGMNSCSVIRTNTLTLNNDMDCPNLKINFN